MAGAMSHFSAFPSANDFSRPFQQARLMPGFCTFACIEIASVDTTVNAVDALISVPLVPYFTILIHTSIDR